MLLRLKEMRLSRGLTQQEMAEKLGVKVATYGTWERGEHKLDAAQLFECAVILDCSCDAIVGHDVPLSFTDPRQAELNRCWESMRADHREHMLGIARGLAEVGRSSCD